MKKKLKYNEFKIPSTYFNHFEDKLFKKIDSNKKKEFIVPENYFKDLENSIFEKTIPKRKTIRLKALVYFSAIAASLVLFISILIQNKNTTNFNSLSKSEIETYILENTDTYTLTVFAQELPDYLENNNLINSDEILDYLQETDIESLF